MTQEIGRYLLGRRVGARILDLHLETFGALPVVADAGGETLRSTAPGDIANVPLDRLAQASAAAIKALAAADSLRNGREPLRPQDWRVICYGLTSAGTLREALAHCIDCFGAIDGRCGTMRTHPGGALIEVELDAGRRERTPSACLIDLVGLAQIHALLAWLIGRPLPLARVALAHDAETFRQFGLPDLPFALELAARRTGFAFDASYLDHPVVSTMADLDDRPIGSFLFETGVAGATGRRSAAEAARRIALRSLRSAGTLPPFGQVVSALSTSAATLRRRLAEEGTSYRMIRDSCRRELGLELLQGTTRSIEDIAAALDFCDADAFRRAFRTWMGISPGQYRRDAARTRDRP